MAEPDVNRKIAAILSADAAGRLRLMHADERAPVAIPKGYRAATGRVNERHKRRVVIAAMLESNPEPTDNEIDLALKDNLCRCGAYTRIRKAVHTAPRSMA